jgi:hypothetical protein
MNRCAFDTELFHTVFDFAASVVSMPKTTTKPKPKPKSTTPWGQASLVDEVRIQQRAGDKRFASLVQLLEGANGELFVRIAYSTDGVSRRGPVTLRAQDVERLRVALEKAPSLADALRLNGSGEA